MNQLNAHDEFTQQDTLTCLRNLLSAMPDIEFSVLVGSQAEGKARAESDWDIALQWKAGVDWMTVLGNTETLRRKIADAIGVTPDKIDLIELRRANLAMRANVAEIGLPLTGENTLAWARFLNRTWRELEDFYWEKTMRLDLYQAETARIAAEQMALLNQAREVLAQGRSLTKLEQSGLLHALQILIENSIGKAKQILKARNVPVPVSAYDAFAALVGQGEIETA